MSTSAFVFAVCGAREHLDRAAAAAARLGRFTSRRIVVLTDPSRNEAPLAHDDVLALRTSPTLSHAEAAIVLKTSVAEALPDGGPHAYLDSDVFAVAAGVDAIFDQFVPPVTFASDLPTLHSTLRRFSSHAVDCACAAERERLERFFERLDSLTALHRAHGELRALDDPSLYSGARFEGTRGERGRWRNGEATGATRDGSIRFVQCFEEGEPVSIVYRFASSPWRLEREAGGAARFVDDDGETLRRIDADRAAGGSFWEDGRGDSFRIVAGRNGDERWWYREGRPARRWTSDPARDAGGFWADPNAGELGACDHLRERLESLFGVAIRDPDWVPWNGGVFLFDGRSRPLLADWRERCLRIFATPGLRARDQGALVATAWANRLESHPRLAARFNRIVDRRSPRAAEVGLADLRGEGACLLHLIGGGGADRTWPLGRDLVDDGRSAG